MDFLLVKICSFRKYLSCAGRSTGPHISENLMVCVFLEEMGVTGRAGELGQDDWVGAGGGVLVGGLCLSGEELVRMICLGRDIRPPFLGKLLLWFPGIFRPMRL